MTPADRRITELIDKWLASIDLHLKYVELSDAAYARAQAWPKHDRPTRWVLEVARQKILELKSHARIDRPWATASSPNRLSSWLSSPIWSAFSTFSASFPWPTRRETDSGIDASQTIEAPTVIKAPPARPRPADR